MNWIQSGDMEKEWQNMMRTDNLTSKAEMYEAAQEQFKVTTTNLPVGMRTPNADEIQKMEAYGKEYKKKNPKASTREIRRATQRKFNIQMLPNTKDS